jgi:hypothetical protein
MFAPLVAKPKTKSAGPLRAAIAEQWHGRTARAHDNADNAARIAGREATPSWDFSKVPVFSSSHVERPQQPPLLPAPRPGPIQAKLKVGAVNDPLEHEADRVADQVLTGEAYSELRTPPRIQRLAAQPGEHSDAVPASVDAALSYSGSPLEPALRQDMRGRFGYDFAKVRVHCGSAAEQSARDVNAAAYTAGHDIVFARGRYAPHTSAGRHLLAHELTHVVQQSGSDTASPVPATRLFRQPEAHYPTEEEQHKIEELLSRDFKKTGVAGAAGAVTSEAGTVTPVTGAATPEAGKPAEKRTTSLDNEQRAALAARLEEPFFDTLSSLDTPDVASSEPLVSKKQAPAVVESARRAVFDLFGKYAIRTATLTQDTATTPESRKKDDQILLKFEADMGALYGFGRTITTTHCKQCASELTRLDEVSKAAVIRLLVNAALTKRSEQYRRTASKRTGGAYTRSEDSITLPLTGRDAMLRSAVHELIHALAHPAFTAAFGDEDNVNEGFTEYFAHQVSGGNLDSGYADVVKSIDDVRKVMSGPFHFVGGDASAEESLRQAYFRGHLEFIGWVPSGPAEQKAVEEARGPEEEAREPAQWDANTARARAAVYRAQAQAQQGASKNVLQAGLFFGKESGGTVAVRFARVIARNEPYAKGQLFLEGQILGSQSPSPGVGASLGIGAEYQDPIFTPQAACALSERHSLESERTGSMCPPSSASAFAHGKRSASE